MTSSLLLLSLLAPPAEAASQIVFGSDLPVRLYVDGTQVHYTSQLKMISGYLEPGEHEVIVTTLLGRALHQEDLVIEDDTQLHLRWSGGSLETIGRTALSEAEGGAAPTPQPASQALAEPAVVSASAEIAPAAEPAPALPAATEALAEPEPIPEPAPVVADPTPAPAAPIAAPVVEVPVQEPAEAVVLAHQPEAGPSGATRLAAVATTQGEVVVYQLPDQGVAIQIQGDRPAIVELRGDEMKVQSGAGTVLVQLDGELGVNQVGGAPTAPAAIAPVEPAPIEPPAETAPAPLTEPIPGPIAPDPAAEPDPTAATPYEAASWSEPAAPAIGVVELISRDGEWANVYVDGEFVAAVSSMQPQARLDLPAGTHFLEIVDPRTGERWETGDLEVLPDLTLKVGFGRDVALEVFEHPEVWRPG